MSTIHASAAEAIRRSPRIARRPLSWNPKEHALARLTFGAGTAARARIAELGVDDWVAEQIRLGRDNPGYSAAPNVLVAGPLLMLSPAAVRTTLKLQGREFGPEAMHQLTRVTLGLQAWSPAQLYEVLVDVFANHLNVPNHDGEVWNTRHAYDRDVIRAHAMGTFTDMLLASARHPAMLVYLDLASSHKDGINENYGRELLELHTVGRIYSEADVQNAARLLTGRTVEPKDSTYRYDPAMHWTGPVRVLDFEHPNSSPEDGEAGGDLLLRHLAKHPATARMLARKLCTRLVSDDPSSALVDAVAKAYLDGGTAIPSMVATIVRAEEFWTSRGAKVRRPTENLLAALRVLDARPASMTAALQRLHSIATELGHVPLDHPAPDGYADVATRWRSSAALLGLWRAHRGLIDGSLGNAFKTEKPATFHKGAKTSGEALAALARRLTGGPLSSAQTRALQAFLNEPAKSPIATSRLKELLVPVCVLILNGPAHATH
jgi:uncharacterized protein (DUF1800 family)